MRLVFFGDLHIADRAPVGRIDDYTFTALGKLEHIARVCEEYQAAYAFSTGDIYHLKQPNRVSHALVQELIRAFNRFSCQVNVVAGNHDLGPDELESLPRQPLGVLARAGAIRLLTTLQGFASEGTAAPEVWVVPRPWNTQRDADPTYYAITQEEQKAIAKYPVPVIGLAHGSVVNPGNRRPFPFVDVGEVPNVQAYDLFIAGHLHENLGVSPVGEGTLFANPGSVMRIARNSASYTRKVQVLKVEVTNRDLKTELIDIPVAPATEVFGSPEPEPETVEVSDAMQRFLEQLGEGIRADQLSIPELLADLDTEPVVKLLVQRYLEDAAS